MTKPRFMWHEDEAGRLVLEVSRPRDSKTTVWTIGPRTSNQQLYQILGEVMMEVDPLVRIPPEQALRAAQKPKQDPEPVEDTQQSEEASKDQLAARAKTVSKTDGQWFANMVDQDTELPLYTIGHGGEPG